jgi:hypothetical protein
VERYLKEAVVLLFRADAAFAKPRVHEYLESPHIGCATRLPANEVEVLQEHPGQGVRRPKWNLV